MSGLWTWWAIGVVTLATLVTRSGLLLLGGRVRLPIVVDHALRYAPACALAALVVPDLVLVDGQLYLHPDNLRLMAALAAALAFVVSRSLVLTMVAGMLAFTALRLLA
jgi:branched-subunit amino acid transport protein